MTGTVPGDQVNARAVKDRLKIVMKNRRRRVTALLKRLHHPHLKTIDLLINLEKDTL